MAFADRGQAANAGTHSDVDELPLMSPGLFSHALCKIGFYCIDYLTATSDEEQAFPNRCVSVDPKLQEDDFGADWRTDLAAAVCGKRTAALERKRVRSRTMNQDHLASYGMTRDPWFDTLDRLSRWDEVARK
ncbi:hypothetical protein EMPS_08072 [Entomortierella parvispora]|uniref:Uncharacterized protein n=1 Tax=Entomortierella parvispora TaxID=205924 RepID=A0A9P3LYZ3_9FUNG|nr:hypothetical protein EMPS_08072 [Entomortierella parvispora]